MQFGYPYLIRLSFFKIQSNPDPALKCKIRLDRDPETGSCSTLHGGVLSPYLFAVYLDNLSNELNNIKAGCYIGEVLLNHSMFADDICVFCPSVRTLVAKNTRCVSGLCRIAWDYLQLQQNCLYDV